jgi:hypothetical protein
MPNLRQQYDVVIYPHVSGTAQSMVAGVQIPSSGPVPYKKSAETPSFGTPDSTDDIRGGMGMEGLMNLYKFVQDGGTLITEGGTSTLFPEYRLTPGVTVENPGNLFARGTILKGVVTDAKSPVTYGLMDREIPVYFSQAPVLNVGGGGGLAGFGGGRGGAGGYSQNTQPMASQPNVASIAIGGEPAAAGAEPAAGGAGGRGGRGGGGGGGRGGRGGGAPAEAPGGGIPPEFAQFAGGGAPAGPQPRVIVRFPTDTTQMLLSGALAGGQALSNRVQVVDSPIGKGHVVSFAIRPFWRWQTQGTYIFGFNTILNWNDLDAGKSGASQP